MKKFIKLHRSANNAVVIINVDNIIGIMNESQNGKKVTQIWLNASLGNYQGLLINESAEKVYAMLEALAGETGEVSDPSKSAGK